MRTVVVLPAPLGPRTPSTVPRGTSRSMPSSARTFPNDLTRPPTEIAGSSPAASDECISGPYGALGQYPSSISANRRMSETSTSSRLLTLLSLLQGRRDWPGGELASRLEVSPRTVRRDVERLRNLGYPIESLSGPAGGYRMAAGTAMPPLLLDDEEAIAIAVGLRTAARASVEGIEETSIRALVKLEQVLPEHLRRRVQALHGDDRDAAGAGPSVDPQDLTVVAAACRDRERLRFGYRGREGATSRREVEPHSLVNLGRRWYLVAWDCGREDWRTFRLDRIIAAGAGGRCAARAARRRRRVRVAGNLTGAPTATTPG